MRRWELVDGGSAKFWEAGAAGAAVRVRYGRIGTEGRLLVKELADPAAAAAHLAKLVAEKERKGYLAVDGGGADGGPGVGAEAEEPAGTGAPAGPAAPDADAPATAATAALPDEDAFVLPEAWREHVLPRRRGGVPVPLPLPEQWPVVDAAEVAAAEAGRVAERREAIEQVLTAGESDPGPVAAVRAYLAGELDPAGLMAVTAMTRLPAEPGWQEREFAGWVARFGLGVAVRAAVASFEVDTVWARMGRQWSRLTALDLNDPRRHSLLLEFQLLAIARRALAAAPEGEHAAVVAELAALRDTPLRRAAGAFLVPERTDWVEECLSEASGHGQAADAVLQTLLLSAVGSAEQARRAAPEGGWAWVHWTTEVVATLADGAGPGAAPLVTGALERFGHDGDRLGEYAGYLAQFPTDAAMGELVDRITEKPVRLALLAAVERFPVRAVRVLSAAARRGGAAGAAARQMLNGHVAVERPRLPELLARLDGEVAAYVRDLEGAREPLPEAPADRLPALLVDPPWARPRTARKPKVLTGVTADERAELHWEEGESAAFAATAAHYWSYPADTDWAAEAQRVAQLGSSWLCCRLLAQGPAELVTPLLDSWNANALADGDAQLPPVLAKYGTAALRLVHAAVLARPAHAAQVLLPVRSAVAAGVMADALVRLKSVQPVARSWFARHGVAGALLLVPAAVGKAGRARLAAEHALRLVALREGAEVLTAAVAERYGEQVATVVAEALGSDPLETALPAKLPELPSWLRPQVLPQVQLADGSGALPLPAVRHLLTVLQLGKLREPYPGLAVVADALRADTVAAFCRAVFEEWLQAGMPSSDGWALYALGEVGDDDTARRLAPVLREWPGQNAHQRAVEGLDVLAAIGTDAALAQLHGIAQRVKFKALRARAQEKIAEIAESLDLTAEQLGDRLVPDLGLDADGSTVIDYGSRKFTVGFDEQLRPYVRDADGRRRKDLPAPGARDDQERATAERKRFATLKKDVRTLATDQIARLETAMVTERTWSTGEFTDLLVDHPLLGHLVRRLLWTADGAAFRVAEDRTFTDVHDEPFHLTTDAVVRLAHPLHLTTAELAAWAELFADYELVQPFRQLGRPVAALTEEEAAGHRLRRFEKHTVPVGRLLGLTKRGWQRGEPQDGGVEGWIHKPLPNGRHLVVEIQPGITVGYVNEFGDQTFEAVWLGASPDGYWPNSREPRERLGDLDPVTVSELLVDLEELTAG
ncbi:hypothetical protein Kpho02_32260 [Kitasatospora phosalacinea]|uniref:WGR domain-containing protein n=1 Tax=Kitasatospora phosalacinea TaxID=2065 RepID=A0A9W6Q6N3_9ACTN|nr:DUF4132 domain-containing protein [Kitasatospora phosalacinea]GLW70927.1 hypothetical protein Kpho02_32260 [Kitasatospora phosalacinea]